MTERPAGLDEECKCSPLMPVAVLGCVIVTGVAFLILVSVLVWHLLGT